ncbi:lactosylceramide 4-alpha-galactosyltransferase-like [Penaeus monodon]|uniref:lactosylceramide 4-alpha-galactosyltransferase-like n=1 Tax=Penaeus monodon TaxID=6687 RepID=UPI0018A7C4AC|nr:lactosylceramide 4-alpha-galactosyltransferase-like [Penaeus monodon]
MCLYFVYNTTIKGYPSSKLAQSPAKTLSPLNVAMLHYRILPTTLDCVYCQKCAFTLSTTPLSRISSSTARPVSQLSDLLRVVLTWRFGGFYSDTDTVCIKDLSPLKNVVVTSHKRRNHISNGVFHFKHHHEFLTMAMSTMIRMYNPKHWGSMGPNTFSSCVQRSCNLRNLRYLFPENSSVPVTCGNVTILPEFYLLPYAWYEHRNILEPGKWDEFVKTHAKTFTIHVFGQVNKGMQVKIGSNSIYEGAARTFCPLLYIHASAKNSSF